MRSVDASRSLPALLVVAAEELFARQADWLARITAVAQAALHYPAGSVAIQLRPRSAPSADVADGAPSSAKNDAPDRLSLAHNIRRIFERLDPHARLPIYVSARAGWLHANTAWRRHVPETQLQAPPPALGEAWSAAVHSVEAAQRAEALGAHLLLFAPVYAPDWKPATPAGVQGLAAVTSNCQVAVLALGGMTPSRVTGCLEAGAAGVAVASGIMCAEDVDGRMRAYADVLGLSADASHC